MACLDFPVLGDDPASMALPRRLPRVGFCAGEQGLVHSIARRLFGRRLDGRRLAALAGAPETADVEVGVYQGGLYLEFSDTPRYRYCGVVRVVARPGRPLLVIEALHIHHRALRGQGLGLRVFSCQLAAAEELHLPRIETHAGRRHDENGYYTWPRYGFAGWLPDSLRRCLPSALADATDVLDLMASEVGRAWWRRHGVAMHLAFDVRPHSRSQQVFSQYRAQRVGKR